jgi:hypothetical protein
MPRRTGCGLDGADGQRRRELRPDERRVRRGQRRVSLRDKRSNVGRAECVHTESAIPHARIVGRPFKVIGPDTRRAPVAAA